MVTKYDAGGTVKKVCLWQKIAKTGMPRKYALLL